MDVRKAYNIWAEQYDTNKNNTRDMEAISLRETLENIDFEDCLEIGCGTGKNTQWLVTKAQSVVSVDLSEEMLKIAKEKVVSENVRFYQADITREWSFVHKIYDLITFSLVLEHIKDLDSVFQKAANAIASKGYLYVGELHPFKQYSGTKARFNTEVGLQEVTCFNHHISDFTHAAKQNGFRIEDVKEYFDNGDRTSLPRILTLLFKKD